jgi:hypothetical protein
VDRSGNSSGVSNAASLTARVDEALCLILAQLSENSA